LYSVWQGVQKYQFAKSREKQVTFADVSGMVNYSSEHDKYMSAIFPPKDIDLPLGEVISNAGMTQMRMAETEKYPHVTFFLNGGREEPFDGEDRIMVPSPKVATYDCNLKCQLQNYQKNYVTQLTIANMMLL